jgi:hypothetical protein
MTAVPATRSAMQPALGNASFAQVNVAASSGGAYDLSRIQDPILELVADTTMKQIHHGIYKVTAMLRDGKPLTFAFKTECRPASKWHGQQGWSEVGVYAFTQLYYGALKGVLATAPPARGVMVAIPKHLVDAVVHRDRCGSLTPDERSTLRTMFPKAAAGIDDRSRADSELMMYAGVALTWQARHDDNALPPPSSASWFRPSAAAELSDVDREKVSQMSDVSLMDYLLSNEDREEKNWFYDGAGRYVMMDNGWAFAGRGYKGSVCSEERALLTCPPIMRHWAGARCNNVVNCRFRVASFAQLNATLNSWTGKEVPQEGQSTRTAWVDTMVRDPLVALFLEAYGSQHKKEKALVFNNGLARYVHGCPTQQIGDDHSPLQKVLGWLALGLERRMIALQGHIHECVKAHGATYVFGASP